MVSRHYLGSFALWLFLFIPAIATGEQQVLPVTSFEGNAVPSAVIAGEATISLTRDGSATDGAQALRIEFRHGVASSGVTITGDQPWDCGSMGDCRLTFGAVNVGASSIQLRCLITSHKGVQVRRAISLPVGETQTVYFPLVSETAVKDRGLRDDPPSLEGCGRKMLILGAKIQADMSVVKSIKLYVEDAADDDVLVIDNVRFASNPPIKPGYLEGIVDKFGQRVGVEFPQKVHSEDELKRLAQQELARLAESSPLPDRGTYGGWKEGPRLQATGNFRAEKFAGQWTLVDPEGYLYFSTGIDNLRMANTSTFTGVDFKDPSVRYRDPEDVTPEDSLGIVPTADEPRATRYVAYPERHQMFQWLPKYDNPLAKHYGYRRSAHRGPFPHGEVFSFYRANLERRYGAEQTMETWRRVTIDRMHDWGFTSFGNWTDASFYQNDRIPYFANGWIIGDFKTVSSGQDYWGAMPDPFDPEFKRRAEVTAQVIAGEVQSSPWCVGVFIDNEKAWGNVSSTERRYGIVINTLGRDAADSPTKAKFVEMMRAKYDQIESLNTAWGTQVASWDAFASGVGEQRSYDDPEMLADFSAMLEAYADQYFRIVHDALQQTMPHHMYLGCRMTPWGMTPETRRAASRYADVMSYNFYREALGEHHWHFLDDIDMPSIIGEWHMGATDTGLPHAGIIHAADQQDRGRMYQTYMRSVIDNPYFVGAHWFQYIDSPITGRAHDGENYNIGFVTTADIPYAPLVDAAREVNRELYQRRFGDTRPR